MQHFLQYLDIGLTLDEYILSFKKRLHIKNTLCEYIKATICEYTERFFRIF